MEVFWGRSCSEIGKGDVGSELLTSPKFCSICGLFAVRAVTRLIKRCAAGRAEGIKEIVSCTKIKKCIFAHDTLAQKRVKDYNVHHGGAHK